MFVESSEQTHACVTQWMEISAYSVPPSGQTSPQFPPECSAAQSEEVADGACSRDEPGFLVPAPYSLTKPSLTLGVGHLLADLYGNNRTVT